MAEVPSLPEILDAALTARLEGVHTATPGTILSYSASRCTATVRPSNGAADHLDVPVVIPGAWTSGDPVLLVYCEREFDADLTQTDEERRHGVGAALAVPLLARPGDAVDFVAMAQKVIDNFIALADAIQATVVVPNDGGASFKATLLSNLGSAGWPTDVGAAKLKART